MIGVSKGGPSRVAGQSVAWSGFPPYFCILGTSTSTSTLDSFHFSFPRCSGFVSNHFSHSFIAKRLRSRYAYAIPLHLDCSMPHSLLSFSHALRLAS